MTDWRSLPALLVDTAERHGAAPAIISPTETLTYSELFSQALALAEELEPARGGVVALALPKSAALVTAWLACWFAGAAFSTLDPSLPAARAREIVQRLRPRRVLRRSGGVDLGADVRGEHIWLGASTSARADVWSAAHSIAQRRPEELAYVCWTSGSTGAPKGAMLEHRGLPHVIGDQVRAFELDSSARCLWLLRPGFDASLSDVFSCLLAGATLNIAPELESGLTPQALLATLAERRITHLDMPPSLLPKIPVEELPGSLRCVVIGGEAPDRAAAAAWAGRVRLLNVYGPTECTICTSLLPWEPTFARSYIGEPLSAVRYRVGEDDSDEGELWIGGAQLARGYWESPELDAQRFLERGGERWYRSGDRVGRDDVGLYFLGRCDRQLKWRGQLIAPEEVEAELVASGGCHRAHVALSGERLVAVVQAEAPEEARLRAHLEARLPRWMCPTHYVFVDNLPETTTGKLDVNALRALLASLESPSEEPTDLLGVVKAQLGRVDPHLSYFTQGGDSLGVLEVLSQCEALGLRFTPEQLASELPLAELEAQAGRVPDEADARFLERDARSFLQHVLDVDPHGSNSGGSWTLFTGATGFLGSRSLLSLLELDRERCYVALIRARDPHHALARLQAACDAHLPGAFAHLSAGRVRCLVGDIAAPRFGLSDGDFRWLQEHTQEVIHGAARVNLVVPYAVLRPANLSGTAEVLRFCRAASARLHYASTLSVFAATDRCPTECTEAQPLDVSARVSGGYAQSKWAAERLLELAASETGSPSACYRFGLITGDSKSGYAPEDDWLTRVSRAFAELGVAPDAELAFDLTPVDYAARAWATLILRAPVQKFARYHVRNTEVSLSNWLSALRANGAEIGPSPAFEERLRAATPKLRAEIALATTRDLDETRLDARRGLDLFQATGVRFDCRHAEQILADWGVRPPGAPRALLARYAARMLRGTEVASTEEGARG